MYKQYFKLAHAPFSIAPDPRYLFMSERHREALAHLLYGVGSGGGFVLLTGEIGAGKTTVCRCFVEQVPAHCRLAYVFNPKLTVEELLEAVCDEFRIAAPAGGSIKTYVDAINAYLLECHAAGLNNVLVIDEAQNLSAGVLEQLRLLTNLETNERKLLQIILIGQPELRDMLARPELEQLAQRVIARYHLGPLTQAETAQYVQHRMAVAGFAGPVPFPPGVLALAHRLTGGVPRRINLLCDRALLGAYVENSAQVTPGILRRAAREVFAHPGDAGLPRRLRWPLAAAAALSVAALGAAAAWNVIPAAPREAVAAPAAVRTAAPPPASLAQASHDGMDAALRELVQVWGTPLPAGEEGCGAAAGHGLRCYQGKGGLFELGTLDRPAVVTLREGQGTRHAVLVSLNAARATLLMGGRRHTVPTGELATRMDGRFTTLWRYAAPYREHLRPGDRGEDVDQLATQLGVAAGRHAGQPFDAPLQEAVRAFQQRQQLAADGLAGPRTFMRLNQLGGVGEPRLASAGNGK
ncbi:AAA family ATPase [Pseudoduganella sp. GCM10020061]|uniref:ExeA family protein n=1 Tax=Pseudoduganella sp. GCM10020061 TaxID=3317345 RepID=UPI00362C3E9C